MRIGIDIDDTITDTHSCVLAYKKIAYPELDPKEMLPNAIFIEFLEKYELLIHKNVELKDDVVENIQKLHNNNEIIIITSRGLYSEETTKEYLRIHNIPYDEIYFNITEKGLLAKSLNLDIFIDDKNIICKQMLDQGIKSIKMHRDDEIANTLEFTNWNDITNYILNNKGGNNGKNNY